MSLKNGGNPTEFSSCSHLADWRLEPQRISSEEEASLNCSQASEPPRICRRNLLGMENLDAVDELAENLREEDLTHQHHQANLADITMEDLFYPCQTETVGYTSFERFDVEGDEEVQMQFPSHDPVAVHLSSAPAACPSPREDISRGFDMHGMQSEPELNQPHDEPTDNRQEPLREPEKKNVSKKRAKKSSSKNIIDDEHTVIPNTLYHSWLQNSSDIVERGRRSKKHARRESSLKMRHPLDLPNVVITQTSCLYESRTQNSNGIVRLARRNTAQNARTEASSPQVHKGAKTAFKIHNILWKRIISIFLAEHKPSC